MESSSNKVHNWWRRKKKDEHGDKKNKETKTKRIWEPMMSELARLKFDVGTSIYRKKGGLQENKCGKSVGPMSYRMGTFTHLLLLEFKTKASSIVKVLQVPIAQHIFLPS